MVIFFPNSLFYRLSIFKGESSLFGTTKFFLFERIFTKFEFLLIVLNVVVAFWYIYIAEDFSF